MSVFTEILKELAEYSAAVDNGTATHEDFIEFQKLGVRIINAHNRGYFNRRQYSALDNAYFDIKEGFRIILNLNTDSAPAAETKGTQGNE